jgi:hypothetical protein
MSSNQFRQAALAAARRGWHVFPCHPESKRPATKQWEQQATIDEQQIHQCWPDYSRKNVGIATGPSGLLIVDLDQPKNPADLAPEPWCGRGCTTGADVLAWLATEQATSVPHTATVTTPSGGRHLYFRQPPVLELGNSAGRLGWKIDTRGHGGYVLAPGSIIEGHRYRIRHIYRRRTFPTGSAPHSPRDHRPPAAQAALPASTTTAAPWPHSPANWTPSWPRPRDTATTP